MEQEPLEPERPPDETWWERELHRNEKLMDKYMAVLGDNPDWDKWQDPEDLYNKVHFNIDPPTPSSSAKEKTEAEPLEDDKKENDAEESFDPAAEMLMPEEGWEDPDEDPEVNEQYDVIATQARRFACAVFDLEKVPGNADLLYLSAGKVGANLAGGHGLGYDDESICGNVVKCRWALSDCEFCREMLEQLHEQTRDPRYAALHGEAVKLAELIRERIARLRKRVWW